MSKNLRSLIVFYPDGSYKRVEGFKPFKKYEQFIRPLLTCSECSIWVLNKISHNAKYFQCVSWVMFGRVFLSLWIGMRKMVRRPGLLKQVEFKKKLIRWNWHISSIIIIIVSVRRMRFIGWSLCGSNKANCRPHSTKFKKHHFYVKSFYIKDRITSRQYNNKIKWLYWIRDHAGSVRWVII